MAKKRVEERLQKTAFKEALSTANKLLEGKITKEEFAQRRAQETIVEFKDSLTGLFNREFFNQVVVIMTARARRQKEPLAILMFDLDDFKKINDQFGHLVGDRVLAEVGKAVRSSVRASDVASRYGGEEIAILLPVTQEKAAERVAKRLLRNIAKMEIKAKKKKIKITASAGMASYQEDMTAEELIDWADQALLQAKKSGKNRFVKHG